jgi:hypothetical protein
MHEPESLSADQLAGAASQGRRSGLVDGKDRAVAVEHGRAESTGPAPQNTG